MNLTIEKMRDKIYILFGEDAVRLFETETFETFLQECEEGEIVFEVHEFDPNKDNPVDLLYISSGYYDYAIIDETVYNKLK